MQHELLIAFILIYTIDSISPGPAVAMVMARGASVGLLRTLPFIAGLVVGDLMLFVFALIGLVALVTALGPFFFLFKWMGVGYLLYLAYCTWNADTFKSESTPTGRSGWRSFVWAIFIPLGNPRAVGFYVALLPAFMDIDKLTLTTAINFSLAIVVIWSLVLVVYAALADFIHRRYGNTSAQKWLNRGSAGAMVGAAGTVAFREIHS